MITTMIVIAALAVLPPTLSHLRHLVIELLLLIRCEHTADLAHLLHHQGSKCRAVGAVVRRTAHAHGIGLQLVAIANEVDLIALILREVQPFEHAVTARAAALAHPRAVCVVLAAR